MVLTITLNPLLEKRLIFNKVNLGEVNRSSRRLLKSGGKGINVSRQLNLLGIKNSAFTFLGGNNRKVLRNILNEENIDFNYISTKAETREGYLILEEEAKRLTSYFEPNPEVTQRESDLFKEKLEKMINNASVVVLSGSSPCNETDDIFPYAIEIANKLDKMTVLDTYGTHLKNCLEKAPMVAHNNLSEINSSLGLPLNDEEAKIGYLKDLYRYGVKLGFITDGAATVYASKFDFHYKAEFPGVSEIDATGSGDAFVAGITEGLERSIVFDDFLKKAIALGAVNAKQWETTRVTPNDVESFVNKVTITPIGKKMKIIDDSPNI